MMTYLKPVLTATAALTLITSAAQASENRTPNPASNIVSPEDTIGIISIPLDRTLDIKPVQKMERDVPTEYDTDYISKITYDLFGNIDADIGVLKTKHVKSRYRVRPALQPRGRYFKPPNSKLGAGISSKF